MIVFYFLLLTLFCIIFVGFILFIIMQVLAVFTTDAPFIPVPKEVEDDIIKSLGLLSTSILYDLGCGDARILIKAVKKYPEIKAIGVDMGFVPYQLAKFYTRKYKNIKIKREDIFKTNIRDATHIFLYLYPKVVNKLIHDIRAQCKQGTRIVSCDFEFETESPTQIVNLEQTSSLRGKKLFIYIL